LTGQSTVAARPGYRALAGAPRPSSFAALPLPPGAMPLVRGGRPLKRWRYVGVFGPELMLCAARVRIGPLGQAFWAVYDRRRGRLLQRTRMLRRGAVALPPGRLRIADTGIRAELALAPAVAVEVVAPHGAGYAWTRKAAGAQARGSVALDGAAPRALAAGAVVDDSAGYHARHTAWCWSAGVGRAQDGRAVAWSVVDGLNDGPVGSERTLWVEGTPRELGPVGFGAALDGVSFAEGGALAFAREALRARHDELGVVASDYAHWFGTFSGTLPAGLALAEGYGVMERHRARW
jgi:hypothetical protein